MIRRTLMCPTGGGRLTPLQVSKDALARCGRVFRHATRWRTLGYAALIGCAISATGTEALANSRTLELYFTHTRESIKVVYKRNGQYVGSGLRDLNRFLRDWRRNEATKMDPELFDLLWELQQEFKGTIYVVSAYRSPATNSMLRRRSRGVAKNSQHMAGRAIDFYIKGANLAKVRAAGMRRQVGGVGYYPRSGSPFVHMDTASVRAWPRMSRSELARLFPDGKTLHLPASGSPLSGYAEAKKLEAQGKLTKLDGGGGGNMIASLVSSFGRSSSVSESSNDRVRPTNVQRDRVSATPAPSQAKAKAPEPKKPDPAPAKPEKDDDNSGGNGLLARLPTVSLGGLIGRSRRESEAEEATVQPVALPSTPLTAVTPEISSAPPPTPPVAPDDEPAADDADDAEEADDTPIVVTALPPQRPSRPGDASAPTGPASTSPSSPTLAADLRPAQTLAYATDTGNITVDGSPQTEVAAIIPRPSDVEAALRRSASALPEPAAPVPAALSSDAIDALMTPVAYPGAELIANTAEMDGQAFAEMVAPDRRTAAADGVLLAPGFLGSADTLSDGAAEWLDTDRFTGTRVTVFASPRS